ncbi:hypothetical protein V6N13_142049 [Hibiscus sabdariffa]
MLRCRRLAWVCWAGGSSVASKSAIVSVGYLPGLFWQLGPCASVLKRIPGCLPRPLADAHVGSASQRRLPWISLWAPSGRLLQMDRRRMQRQVVVQCVGVKPKDQSYDDCNDLPI